MIVPSLQLADFIGDVHGQHCRLHQTLSRLGYRFHNGQYRHPEGRIPVFMGDLVNRGSQIRETVETVRQMVLEGAAVCLMGNHEFNLLGWFTPSARGKGFVRPHTDKNLKQVKATLKDYDGYHNLLQTHLAWFKTLPIWLETPEYRAVHAAWHTDSVWALTDFLDGGGMSDELLRRYDLREQPVYTAIETLLKGPEVKLPSDVKIKDVDGTERTEQRIAWWEHPDGKTWRQMAAKSQHIMPPTQFPPHLVCHWWGYAPQEVPVFFGHYSMEQPPAPLAPNVVCLDFTGNNRNRVAACRMEHGDFRFYTP